MSTIERMTITVAADMAAALRQSFADGEYASTGEIVREWVRHRDAERPGLAALREAIGAGDESGTGIPAVAVFTEFRQMIADRRARPEGS